MTKTAKEGTHQRSKVLVQVLLPQAVVTRLDTHAAERMVSRAAFVRGAVLNELTRQEAQHDNK